MMKLILLLAVIIAAAVYAGLNWDKVSSKLDETIDTATELKQKGDELHENVRDKLDQAKDKMDDTKDSIEELIDKTK